ncbi:hypothetical protein ABK040_009178 [Willaertia magna]
MVGQKRRKRRQSTNSIRNETNDYLTESQIDELLFEDVKEEEEEEDNLKELKEELKDKTFKSYVKTTKLKTIKKRKKNNSLQNSLQNTLQNNKQSIEDICEIINISKRSFYLNEILNNFENNFENNFDNKNLLILPNEILSFIFSYLSKKEIFTKLLFVCKQFLSVIYSPIIFQNFKEEEENNFEYSIIVKDKLNIYRNWLQKENKENNNELFFKSLLLCQPSNCYLNEINNFTKYLTIFQFIQLQKLHIDSGKLTLKNLQNLLQNLNYLKQLTFGTKFKLEKPKEKKIRKKITKKEFYEINPHEKQDSDSRFINGLMGELQKYKNIFDLGYYDKINICNKVPTSLIELQDIIGVQDYGADLLEIIQKYVNNYESENEDDFTWAVLKEIEIDSELNNSLNYGIEYFSLIDERCLNWLQNFKKLKAINILIPISDKVIETLKNLNYLNNIIKLNITFYIKNELKVHLQNAFCKENYKILFNLIGKQLETLEIDIQTYFDNKVSSTIKEIILSKSNENDNMMTFEKSFENLQSFKLTFKHRGVKENYRSHYQFNFKSFFKNCSNKLKYFKVYGCDLENFKKQLIKPTFNCEQLEEIDLQINSYDNYKLNRKLIDKFESYLTTAKSKLELTKNKEIIDEFNNDVEMSDDNNNNNTTSAAVGKLIYLDEIINNTNYHFNNLQKLKSLTITGEYSFEYSPFVSFFNIYPYLFSTNLVKLNLFKYILPVKILSVFIPLLCKRLQNLNELCLTLATNINWEKTIPLQPFIKYLYSNTKKLRKLSLDLISERSFVMDLNEYLFGNEKFTNDFCKNEILEELIINIEKKRLYTEVLNEQSPIDIMLKDIIQLLPNLKNFTLIGTKLNISQLFTFLLNMKQLQLFDCNEIIGYPFAFPQIKDYSFLKNNLKEDDKQEESIHDKESNNKKKKKKKSNESKEEEEEEPSLWKDFISRKELPKVIINSCDIANMSFSTLLSLSLLIPELDDLPLIPNTKPNKKVNKKLKKKTKEENNYSIISRPKDIPCLFYINSSNFTKNIRKVNVPNVTKKKDFNFDFLCKSIALEICSNIVFYSQLGTKKKLFIHLVNRTFQSIFYDLQLLDLDPVLFDMLHKRKENILIELEKNIVNDVMKDRHLCVNLPFLEDTDFSSDDGRVFHTTHLLNYLYNFTKAISPENVHKVMRNIK